MRILFLNQYFHPDDAPNGTLLAEVAQARREAGDEIDLVASGQGYRDGRSQRGRLLHEVGALWTILVRGLRRPRPALVVSGTSPPCLLIVARLISAWHRARSIHWVMDLYPEIAVALGQVRNGILVKALGRLMGRCYRRAHVVALDADMAARLASYGVRADTIRPWVVRPLLAPRPPAAEPERPWTWIYSGNLGRAHEWETLLAAQALVERRDPEIRLLFQGGGPSWPAAQARARELGLARCEWRAYVEPAELTASLLRGQVTVVTQRPSAQGLLWPSKLALAMALPRPVLWVGPREGAVAREVAALPRSAVFAPGEAAAIADWLLQRKQHPQPVPQSVPDAGAQRAQALAAWHRLIEGLAAPTTPRGAGGPITVEAPPSPT
jgi:putative colanic acid biosynthesis glycosyltransferase WcaI